MTDTQDWMAQSESSEETYKYFMRTDPDMRKMLGPIEIINDLVTGREMRRRSAKIAMMRGSADLHDVEVYLDPVPHVRLDKAQGLRGWYSGKGDGEKRGQRERPCETDAMLTSPYGGTCEVQCGFCYINSGHRGYRGTGLTTVPMGYGKQVREQLAGMKIAQAGYFSSFHDPFNSLEDYYHNTRQGAEAFVGAGLPIFFLSRLSYPDWAIDLLRKNKFSYAQKSINTPDEEDWKKLSPRAITLARHFEEIRKLRDAGIYVSIQCNPIVAGIVTHDDVERLFEKLAEAGANHVIVKFVEANHPWAPSMVERITKKFGDNRSAAFRDLFVENSCGAQKTIVEEYRREGHTRYQRKATELGMTYALCYEYTKRTGTWRSMGPEFLTSDQCHGHRVPFFTKSDSEAKFRELAVCPPSGCLRCADNNDGEAKCGSELLGSAKALVLSDFKKDPGIKKQVERFRARR